MRFGRLVRAIFAIPLLVGAAQAAKVLVIYNPWANTAYQNEVPQIWGGVSLWNKEATPLTLFKSMGNDWFSYTFPTATPGDFSVLIRPPNGTPERGWLRYRSTGYEKAGDSVVRDLNIDAFLSVVDTVWMVPNSRLGGPPKYLIQHPKEINIEFWNPWEGDFPNQPPSVQVAGFQFEPMQPGNTGKGWWKFRVIGYSTLDLVFRSPNGTSHIGSQGLVTSSVAPAGTRFDSLATANTIWIYQTLPPTGKLAGQVVPPRARVIEVFNPWDGRFPFQKPTFRFPDGFNASAAPIYERCGWFRVSRMDLDPASVLFANDSGTSFGTTGFGSVAGFQLSSFWSAGIDTVRIFPDSAGRWTAAQGISERIGQCYLTRLAATVRDFDTTHPAFEKFYACGVTPGMVKPVLGSDGKPVWDSAKGDKCGSSTIYDWFHDNPKYSYKTCTDIPLELNPATSIYRYENTRYFPLDNIPKTINPRNIQYPGEDGKNHNFHFCLETHAVFDYRKGQKFDFVGDDDVWVYIDNRLVVDLGGVHDAAPGSVLLDTMGLVEGRTYPFDFFFCERRTMASNMLITTSMNLRNPPEFELRESILGAGKRLYDLLYHQKLGQACDAEKVERPTPGLFYITGPQFPVATRLNPGLNLGGLTIRGDSAQMLYDSLAMDRLKPGIYTVRVKMLLDTTQYKDVVFEIPLRPEPKFVTRVPWGGRVTTSMPLEIQGWLGPQPATFAVNYQLDPVPGLRFCADSACTVVFTDRQMLSTGASGEKARIWVRGDSIGVYSLFLRNVWGDSSDFRTRIVFQDRGLRWLDSLGKEVQPYEILRDPSGTAKFWIEAYQGAGRCDTCSDLLLLGADNPGVRFLNPSTKAPIQNLRLVRGLAAMLVVSDVPAEKVTLTATVPDSAFGLAWYPVSWRAYRLEILDTNNVPFVGQKPGMDVTNLFKLKVRIIGVNGPCTSCNLTAVGKFDPILQMIDTTGKPTTTLQFVGGIAKVVLRGEAPGVSPFQVWIPGVSDTASVPVEVTPYKLVFLDGQGNVPGPGFLSGEILIPRQGVVVVVGRDGICTKCNGPISVSSSTGIRFVTLAGDSIGQITASGGAANYTVYADREVLGGELRGNMPTYFAVGGLSPMDFVAPPPDSGAWFDEDGDGRPDRLKVWLHLAWTEATQIFAAWPDWSKPFMPSAQNLSVIGGGMVVDVLVPEGLDGGTVAATTDLGRWTRDSGPVKPFPVFDRVAPVPMRALIHRGKVWDTLRVLPSEAVGDVLNGEDVLRKLGAGETLPKYDFADQWRDPATGEFVFLFSATQIVNVPEPGDWVRFAPGGRARDVLGNVPGLRAKAVQIFGTDRAPADAVMRDSDGDGRADQVVLRLLKPLVSSQSWIFRWPDTTGGLDMRFAETVTARVDSFGLKLTFDIPPYIKGMTACPAVGCDDLGTLMGTYQGVALTTPFRIRDGVPPIAIGGKMTFSGDDAIPDTLVVRFSEPVNPNGLSTQWVAVGDTILGNQGKVVSPWSARLDSNGLKGIFLVDTNVAPKKGQGIRITPGMIGGISDRLGNFPTDTAAWGPLELGPIPPRLLAKPYPAMGRWDGTPPDPTEPTLQVLVRRGIGAVSAEWKTLDGKPFGLADTSGHSAFVGAKLELNGLTEGAAYVYDNMGVFVAYTDLKPVIDAMANGSIETDTRDRYEVWVAWNGVYNQKIAPSGVYLMRILGYRKLDNRMFIQQKVVRMGWMVFPGR